MEIESIDTCKNSSYNLLICEHDQTNKHKTILRKFHFDYDSGIDPDSNSKKPFFHLQS